MSSPVRQTSVVADTTQYPYSTALKMFYTNNGQSIGSAVVVGKRAVLACGRHVYRDGRWSEGVQFIPQYANGGTPLGTFTAVKSTTLKEFVDLPGEQGSPYEIAACVVDRDFPPELGVAGVALNHLLQPGKLRSIGYPAVPTGGFAFDGQRMWESVGDYHHEADLGFGTTSPRMFAHYSDLAVGATGGPIFTDGPNPLLVGLNNNSLLFSNGQLEQPPRRFSPYFGEHVQRLINWLSANGGMDAPPVPSSAAGLKAQLQAKVAELSALLARLPG